MQTASCNLGGTVTVDGQTFMMRQKVSRWHHVSRYVIGIDGATFINNFIAPTLMM